MFPTSCACFGRSVSGMLLVYAQSSKASNSSAHDWRLPYLFPYPRQRHETHLQHWRVAAIVLLRLKRRIAYAKPNPSPGERFAPGVAESYAGADFHADFVVELRGLSGQAWPKGPVAGSAPAS